MKSLSQTMNIIIPLGGVGNRFRAGGYDRPKPFVRVLGKEILTYILDHIDRNKTPDDEVFIVHHPELTSLQDICAPYVKLIELPGNTRGAAETINYGLKRIENRKPCLLLDGDTFYTEDVLCLFRNLGRVNALLYFHDFEGLNLYSYIRLEGTYVIDIVEKPASFFSTNANTGAYYFCDKEELERYTTYDDCLAEAKAGEFYTSYVIKHMLSDGKPFKGVLIDHRRMVSLGTPQQVQDYVDNHFELLLDLDGTIVLTDDIYVKVWKELLVEHDVDLSRELFCEHIQGNDDKTAIENLKLVDSVDLKRISSEKDRLFIENIDCLRYVPGSVEFIKNHGHKVTIVTNCNRKSAEAILVHAGLEKYVKNVVIGAECDRPKPFPDPYLKALEDANVGAEKAIIFEDSRSGVLSALSAKPFAVVGVKDSCMSADELYALGVDVVIDNFLDLEMSGYVKIEHLLRRSFPDSKVFIRKTKLKGGFIANVIKVVIVRESGETLNCILKYKSEYDPIVDRLDLYNREEYFYENMQAVAPIRTPKCHAILSDLGILLEDMDAARIGIDLNTEPIEHAENILSDLAGLHKKFWNNFSYIRNDRFDDWPSFVEEKWSLFKHKWTLSEKSVHIAESIVRDFADIQRYLSRGDLTLCHGDVKSANIFFQGTRPCFIDWQYLLNGKGVQDVAFFLIESFETNEHTIRLRDFYYRALTTDRSIDYRYEIFLADFKAAASFFPFFVAMWFGTIDEIKLVDKAFPRKYIKRLFEFLEFIYEDDRTT